MKKGTTTVGVVCTDGVVIAADQLSSLGDFKFNKDAKKVHEITPKIVMTTAGSVGDNQALLRFLRAQMKIYDLEEKEPTVKAVATLISNILSEKYLYTYLPYQIFDLLGGYDSEPSLYSIDMVGGVSPEKEFSATGSGMTVAYGILDAEYKKEMTVEEGLNLAVKAIVAARKRISSVGGENITVYTVTKDGAKEIPSTRIKSIADKLNK